MAGAIVKDKDSYIVISVSSLVVYSSLMKFDNIRRVDDGERERVGVGQRDSD